jgi:flavin reductase (DIM6/NTAB) family NADH-FMN oxidoreductase RutF
MQKIDKFVLDPVLPVSLIGTQWNGQINFMTCAWFTRLEVSPYLYGVSVQQQHFTHKAIMENKVFSINIPPVEMIPQVDAAGLSSGREYDKSQMLQVFEGEYADAPMVKGSIVAYECDLVNSVELSGPVEEYPRAHTLFVGRVKNVWADPSAVEETNLQLNQKKPIFWSWAPRQYWALGEPKGAAFNIENKKWASPKH